MHGALVAERVTPLLRGRFGSPYRYRASCASTQALLQSGDPEGAVAVADLQTEGRGRLGRRWEAQPGSAILLSVLLRPANLHTAPQLALVGGLAAAAACEGELERRVSLKWPNDVLVDGRKIAGVLAEGREGAVVLGIGINVNQTEEELPPAARTPPASLRTVDGRCRDRAVLLASLLAELERTYDLWRDAGLVPLHAELTARDCLEGSKVEIGGRRGVAAGIDPEGRLLLRHGGEVEAIASDEVTPG